jgi:hypothetical protein
MPGEVQEPAGNGEGPADVELRTEQLDETTVFGAAAALARRRTARTAETVIMLIGGAIAMGETERLMTGALTSYGSSRSVTDIIGMAALSGGDAWRVWLDLSGELRRSVAIWLFLHAVFDIAFYLGYWLLLRRLVAPVSAARRALRILLVLEVVETLLLWAGSGFVYSGGVPGLFRAVVAIVASLKWVTGGFLILVILVAVELRTAVVRGAVRLIRAVWEQRLSLVVVAVVGVLSLIPGPHIWDQLPDAERSWLDGDPGDVWHGVWAVIATVLVGLYLFVVGRLRSERVWTARVGDPLDNPRVLQPPQAPPVWWWWLVPPVATLAIALLLEALPVDGLVDWENVRWAVLVPLVILALSGLIALYYQPPDWLRRLLLRLRVPAVGRWLRTRRTLWQEPPVVANDEEQHDRALDVWVVGDVLAVSVVVVAGLGLVRSLLAPVLLGPPDDGSGTWLLRMAVLVAGAVVAGGAFPLANAWLDRLDRQPLPQQVGRAPLRWLLRPADNRRAGGRWRSIVTMLLWLSTIAVLVALMVWPLQLGRRLGVVATTLAALGAWAAVLGFLIVQLQYRRPLPLFRILRMRSTPGLTLLLVAPLLASQAGGDPDLHALSGPPGGPPAAVPDRPSLSEAFAGWLERSQGCDRPIDTTDDQAVRPMVLVAASGGGIRAAVWTVEVLERLRAAGDCASQAVFLSSGISGGSVGLALSRGQDPTGDARGLASPDALAAGIAGTLVGDLVGGSTGLRIPSLSLVNEHGTEPAGRSRWRWRDRAALMEAVWEFKAPSLTNRYDQLPSGPAGMLVMNSAAAGRGCRVFVSQVELTTGPQETADQAAAGAGSPDLASCQGRTSQPAASLDLQDTYRDCTPDMSWATAAMLSARFPWILPGGRVPPVRRALPTGTADCTGQPNLQLIDGGYAEGSGIGTLADLAPGLLQVVRDHNATKAADEPLVVPVVLYLEDETRKDIVRQPQGLSPELFVPVAGRNAGAVQTSSGTWLQRMASSIADPCPPGDRQRCLDAVEVVQGQLSGGIVIAAPLTKPSVEAPLGWTLSEDSRSRLAEAADAQATGCPPVLRPGGYPCLKQLLDVLEPHPA